MDEFDSLSLILHYFKIAIAILARLSYGIVHFLASLQILTHLETLRLENDNKLNNVSYEMLFFF